MTAFKYSIPMAVLMLLGLSCGNPRQAESDEFRAVSARLVEQYVSMHPELALHMQTCTEAFDPQLYSAGGISRRISFARAVLDSLARFDTKLLTIADRVDYDILAQAMDAEILMLGEYAVWRRDPAFYDILSPLMEMLETEPERALPVERIRSCLRAVPRVTAHARNNLTNTSIVAVSNALLRHDAMLRDFASIMDSLCADLPPDLRVVVANEGDAALAALRAFGKWMRETLLPRSSQDFRSGGKMYDRILGVCYDVHMTASEILMQAEYDFAKTSDALFKVSLAYCRSQYPGRDWDTSRTGMRQAVVKIALETCAGQTMPPDSLLQAARGMIDELRNFAIDHSLLNVPEGNITVRALPGYRQNDPPGTCEIQSGSEPVAAISLPVPDNSWMPWQRIAYLRSVNRHALAVLLAHEGVPGHGVQLLASHAPTANRIVRRVFPSRLFAEGWACNAEWLMAEAGYGGQEYLIEQLKSRLRIIALAILDFRIHCAGMSERDAESMLTDECYMTQAEARSRITRIELSPAVMSLFYAGQLELSILRRRFIEAHPLTASLAGFRNRLLQQGAISFHHQASMLGIKER
jgi:uncharacterized protein (DUF885 family)